MKFIAFAAVVSCFAFVSAQSFEGLPACALPCASTSIPPECGLDAACICSKTEFIDGIGCCVSEACNQEDQEATLEFARGICGTVSVTNLPSAATCAPTASSTATATSMMASGSSTASSITSSLSASAAAATNTGAANNLVAQGFGVMGAAVAGAVAFM